MMRWTSVFAMGLVACLTAACGGSDEQGQAGGGGTGGAAGEPGAGGTAGASGEAGAGGAAGSGEEPIIASARSDVPYNANPTVSPDDYKAFVANTNAFGLDLYHAIAQSGNLFYSPASTAVALAMTYGGAQGDTATQMAAVMHNDLPESTFHAAVNKHAIDLASRNLATHDTQDGPKSLRLSLINGAFAQKDYTFVDAFLDQLSANYDTGMYLMDFIGNPDASRTTINDWVAFHTEDRIKDLLGPGDIDSTVRLVLTNALYFYGSWNTPFSVDSTRDDTFHTLGGADVTVPIMHQTLYTKYAEGDGYQVVDMPYDGGKVWMTVLLPEAGRFEEIRSAATGEWLEAARGAMSTGTEVSIALPKFKFTWGSESFKAPLEALGMKDAFVPQMADFSGMEPTRQLFIKDVVHKAFVGVDEHGTEAAAATAVIMGLSGVPDPKFVTVDRPFVFFLQDETGALLFVGQVTDPTIP